MSLICPKCGVSDEHVEFIGPFCVKCSGANISVKCPSKVIFEYCKRCDRIKISGKWTKYNKKTIDDYVLGKCKGGFREASYSQGESTATFVVIREGNSMQVKSRIEVEVAKTICQDCSRVAGGYFEAIVQVRGGKEKVARFAKKLYGIFQRKSFVSKVDDNEDGIDLYIGSSKAVVEAFHELRIKALITRKLAGEKDGKRLYRTTFAFRLD